MSTYSIRHGPRRVKLARANVVTKTDSGDDGLSRALALWIETEKLPMLTRKPATRRALVLSALLICGCSNGNSSSLADDNGNSSGSSGSSGSGGEGGHSGSMGRGEAGASSGTGTLGSSGAVDTGDAATDNGPPPQYTRQDCVQIPMSGPDGPTGTGIPNVEVFVKGLQIPWGLAWLPNGDLLVTERPGTLRLVKGNQLQPTPVITIDVAQVSGATDALNLGSEGGLLGVLLHPDFATNHYFYMYWEATKSDNTLINRLGLFKLSADGTTAMLDHVMLDNIPAGVHHQGGRLRIGPDGKLYVPVGSFDPSYAQMANQYPGKLLRMNLDGSIPSDNPTPNSYVFLTGIRNTEGYDWFNRYYLLLMDHGPTLIDPGVAVKGFDEFNVVRAGENLGWPNVLGCNTASGMTPPVLTWQESTPPGGAEIYRGTAIPQWTGSFMFATLGLGGPLFGNDGLDLHRIQVDPNNPYVVQKHEVYLKGKYGRLRTVATGPDGYLYLTTSNCDSRGQGNGLCAANGGDQILRITSVM